MAVYSYARLSKADFAYFRIGGNGLGNLLFTWARCLSRSRQNGWRMIWPAWYSHKPKNKRVNPYDQRTYGDLFSPTADYISGLAKLPHLLFRRRVSESEAELGPPAPGRLVQFRGMAGKFQPFLADLSLVRRELLNMTRPQHLAGFQLADPAPIGLHIRRGDFLQRGSYEETVQRHNSLLPMEWYMAALEQVRARCGQPVPAFVFSDGSAEELAPILAMENVQRVEYGSSIADILALSRSRLLIASDSTFSQWAAYLGQLPAIWHPGKLKDSIILDGAAPEMEWATGDSMPQWVTAVTEKPVTDWARAGFTGKSGL